MFPINWGSVSQSVKDVLQSLVDDGLVQGDKIGSSNFFWSFPSQQGAVLQARLAAARKSQHDLQSQLSDLKKLITNENSARPNSEKRSDALRKLSSLKKQVSDIESELAIYGDSDPAKIEQTKRAAFLAKEAAIRWTENYGILLSHFTRQSGVDASEIRRYLGIDESYEDIC